MYNANIPLQGQKHFVDQFNYLAIWTIKKHPVQDACQL